MCVSWCFAFMSLHPVEGLYQKKSWLELSTETGLRVKTGSEIVHTPYSVCAARYCTSYGTVFPETEGGGMERVLGGPGGVEVGARCTE